MKFKISLCLFWVTLSLFAQEQSTDLKYRLQTVALASDGSYAPSWFTANQFGVLGVKRNQFVAKAGLFYTHSWKQHGNIEAGVELLGGDGPASKFWLHQVYTALEWKELSLSIGSREKMGFPLQKNEQLTSGWMVEGPNARPVPQVRIDIRDYLPIPGTAQWMSLKGHLAYGRFVDDDWQKSFVGAGHNYVQDVLYHSKSIMFRIGKRERFPLEFEFGLLMATQFGGAQYVKNGDGSSTLVTEMPHNLKAYWKAFFPGKGSGELLEGEQVNVEGNMLGSWNFSLNWYPGQWQIRTYLEHYFEDHSQMFWEYGRWRDGQLGIEFTPPQNKWLTSILWEGLCTKYSSGSVLYDGFMGSFEDIQMSGADNYYNHYIYQAWQHYGMGMGNPLLSGPLYNQNGEITTRSNRARSNHLGLTGRPSDEYSWRFLASFTRHWGTYNVPLDKQRKQFSSMIEVDYHPVWAHNWSLKASIGMDRGNYLGNSWGGMLSLCKRGGLKL